MSLIADVFCKLQTAKKTTLQQGAWETSPNTVQIQQRAILPSLLITVKRIESEKVPLHDMENLIAVCYHVDCRWKVSSSK